MDFLALLFEISSRTASTTLLEVQMFYFYLKFRSTRGAWVPFPSHVPFRRGASSTTLIIVAL